jgi:hypothetical protein
MRSLTLPSAVSPEPSAADDIEIRNLGLGRQPPDCAAFPLLELGRDSPCAVAADLIARG